MKDKKSESFNAWPADKVTRRRVENLIPYARNSRTHSEEQVAQIAASVKEWGWTIPVLIDEGGGVIAGHGRILAAKLLGLEEVPCVVAEGWSDEQKRAYVIADNKLALNAGWDGDLLGLELSELRDGGFDLDLIGFSSEEINDILGGDESIPVKEIATHTVEDRFWISVRGPLKSQAQALQRLRDVMAEISGVEVELGTVADDGLE